MPLEAFSQSSLDSGCGAFGGIVDLQAAIKRLLRNTTPQALRLDQARR